MKKLALTLTAVVALVLIPLLVMAADEEKTVTGEPVDIQCYLGGKSGPDHAACAQSCAAKGLPIGLVVSEGSAKQLYLVLGGGGKSAKDLLSAHMGKQVKVTGKVADKDGLKVITVSNVAA